MRTFSNVIVQESNSGISRIKINEPGTYNALSLSTLKSLIQSFQNLIHFLYVYHHVRQNKVDYYIIPY